jgi:hypothetical protein
MRTNEYNLVRLKECIHLAKFFAINIAEFNALDEASQISDGAKKAAGEVVKRISEAEDEFKFLVSLLR